MSNLNIETKCIQSGYVPGSGEPRQIPIVQSTTFKYNTSEEMGKLFDLETGGYFYSRLQNPTCDTVAAKICALEGGSAAMLQSSGMAASFFAVFNIASCGDHVVSSSSIYGGTYNLFAVTMKRMGIEFTFVAPDCTKEELDAAFRPNTKAVFGETISNPALTVLDIEKFAQAAQSKLAFLCQFVVQQLAELLCVPDHPLRSGPNKIKRKRETLLKVSLFYKKFYNLS